MHPKAYALIPTPDSGSRLWVPIRIRKTTRCARCHRKMDAEDAFRFVGDHVGNGDRLCVECVKRIDRIRMPEPDA